MGRAVSNKDVSFNKRALKSGTIFLFMQLLVKGLSFLTTPLYTRMLSTEQYGEIRVYESWVLMLAPVVALNLYRCADQVKFEFGEKKYYNSISSIQTLAYIAMMVFSIILLSFHQYFEKIFDMSFPALILMTFFFFANASLEFMRRREKQMMNYKLNAITTFSTMIPATLLSLLLIYLGSIANYKDALVFYRNLGFYLPQIIGGLVIAALIWRDGKKLVDFKVWKYAIVFCLPLIPEMISIQIMNQSDKLMIKYLVDLESTGIYSLATTVSWIVWVLADGVWNAWQPWLYEKISKNEIADVQKPWIGIMHAFGLLTWLLVAFAPELIYILGGNSYNDAIYLIAPLCLSVLYHFFNNSYSAIQSFYKKTTSVATITVGAMLVNIVLNFVGIKWYGYQAAAYATAFSYFLSMLLQAIAGRRIVGREIIPLKKSVKICLFYLIICLSSMVLYRLSTIVRYMIILIVLVGLAVIFKEQIMTLIKKSNLFEKRKG